MRDLLKRFFAFERDELPVVFLLFSFFFLVIAVFQLLKPLKNGLFIEYYGANLELYAKLGNILIAALGVAFFSFLYDRLKRPHLIYALSGFFVVMLVSLTYLLQQPEAASIWGFYWLGDLESTLMVAAFWAYATDVSGSGQAKRLFGAIGAGGVIGGWVGITIASTFLERVGMETLLFTAAALMFVIAIITFFAERAIRRSRSFNPRKPKAEETSEKPAKKTSAALEGARLVLHSKYLAAIAAIMAFYEIASQVMDYQFKLLTQGLPDVTATQAFMADVYWYANVLSVIVQLFLVSLIMRKFGLVVTLLVMPIALLASSFAFMMVPTLLVASFLIISDNGLNYSIQQTGRETLYVVTSPDAKYKARAFTNMLVQRAAKGVGIFAALGLGYLGGIDPRYLSILTVLVVLGMILASIYAGRKFNQKSQPTEKRELRVA